MNHQLLILQIKYHPLGVIITTNLSTLKIFLSMRLLLLTVVQIIARIQIYAASAKVTVIRIVIVCRSTLLEVARYQSVTIR